MTEYAKGRWAWGICDRCGLRGRLLSLIFDGHSPNMRVHPECWDMKHPQENLRPVTDATALRDPRPDQIPITAPVLSIERVGPLLDFFWTPATSHATMIRWHRLYLSANGGEYELIAQGQNVYDDLGGLVWRLLSFEGYQIMTAPVTFRAYVEADDGEFVVRSEVQTLYVERLDPELLFIVPNSGAAASGMASVSVDPRDHGLIGSGDTMIWVGYASGGTGNNQQNPSDVTPPPGWNQFLLSESSVSDSLVGTVSMGRKLYSYWKHYEPGDVFTFSAMHATEPHVEGFLYAFRGLRQVNPFGYMQLRSLRSGAANTASPNGTWNDGINTPTFWANEPGSILCAQAACRGSLTAFDDCFFSETPIDFRLMSSNIGNNNRTWSDIAAAWRVGQDEIENLFNSSSETGFTTDPWTVVNYGTVGALNQGWGYRTTFNAVDLGAVEHCIYRDVDLVEGQPYTIAFQGTWTTTSNGVLGIQMELDGNVVGLAQIADPGDSDTRGCATLSGIAVRGGACDGPATGNAFEAVYATFIPNATGTHRVKFGTMRSGSFVMSGTSYSMTVKAITMTRGYHWVMGNHPSIIGSSAVTGAPGTRAKMIYPAASAAIGSCIVFEACGKDQSPSQVIPTSGRPRPVAGQPNATIGTRGGWSSSPYTGVNFRLDHHIIPPSWGGPGRYHAEISFPSGTGPVSNSLNSANWFMIAPIDQFSGFSVAAMTNDTIRAGMYGMSSRSTVNALGKVENGTLTAWIATDSSITGGATVVSLSVDYLAGTVTLRLKSATRDESVVLTMARTDLPYILVVNPANSNLNSVNTSSDPPPSSINTTGPFAQKPDGFSAWDWQNEVTE